MSFTSAWKLAGSTTAYAGTLTTTDGYNLLATFTWKAITSLTTGNSGKSCSTVQCVIGTCVETYTAAGTVQVSTVTTDGNHALCHWFILKLNTVNTPDVVTGTTNTYAVANYMTNTQFGTAGASIVGNGILTRGTSIGTTHGFTLNPATKPSSTYVAGALTHFWYQPTYASTYASTALRRYNGGTADGSKVKAYCARQRAADTASTTYNSGDALVAATVGGTAGVVTLTGAQALAAGAIAFGVAALAF